MISYTKVPRGFYSTGISLHWGTSNLIVLTIIVAMLGTTQFALAVHKPFHCWTCCPPNNCGDGEDTIWKVTTGAHVGVANLGYQNQKPTKALLLLEASRMVNYANARQADGTIGYWQGVIIKNINSIYTQVADGTNLFNNTANFGNVIPLTASDAWLGKVVLTERKAAIAFIQTYGLYPALIYYSQILTQWANAMDGLHAPVTISPAMARTFFDGMAMVGLFVMATGDPIGVIIAAGAQAGIMYMDSQGL
jgi:hypothetical protein